MMPRRVVVTGFGLTSPIGDDANTVSKALREQRHGIVRMDPWNEIKGLQTRLAAPAADVDLSHFTRKRVRTMGRVSLLASYATERALEDAGIDEAALKSGRLGLAYGSTHGSSSELESFMRILLSARGLEGVSGTAYLKFMSHTCAANLALCYGVRGRVVPTISACASGSHAIGVGFETIRAGQQDVMLCGGAEELHFVHAGVFDIMYATSTKYNAAPHETPRPFDRARDGLVVGEGAGTLVLEEEARARRRGARIYGEIVGFGMSCDGSHATSPSAEGMASAMRLALSDAGVSGDAIDYVNAHGTATELGDIAESEATHAVMGDHVPFGSTKSYTGHTLGACGAHEMIFCLLMARDRFLPANRNLEEVDPRCAPLNYITGDTRDGRPHLVMSNNFAFGGINTSLIVRCDDAGQP